MHDRENIMAYGKIISINICRPVFFLSLVVLVLITGCKSKDSYRKELEQKGITYSAESFLSRAGFGNRETMDLFIKAGMDVNVKGQKGETALMLAAVNDNGETVKFLIEKGADINAKNDDGYTALMIASFKGDIESAKLLIAKGADMNVRNNNGETALMLAALNEKIEAVKLLVKKGADVHVKSNKGDTAMKYAFLNSQIQELLRKAGAN